MGRIKLYILGNWVKLSILCPHISVSVLIGMKLGVGGVDLLLYTKFHPHRCDGSPLRREKPQYCSRVTEIPAYALHAAAGKIYIDFFSPSAAGGVRNLSLTHLGTLIEQGAQFTKTNLRKNPKFSISFSEVYVRFIAITKLRYS